MQPPTDPEAVRRLDWRFLLPDPALGRVAFVAPGDAELLGALRHVVPSVAIGSLPELTRQSGPRWDLVVVSATDGELTPALPLVGPGGSLYAELPRRAIKRGILARSRRTLAESGFSDVRESWHWPSVSASRRIVPIDHPKGARAPLADQLGRPLRGAEPLLAPLIDRLAGIELAGGRVSLLARRAASDSTAWLCLGSLAPELSAELGTDAPSWTMLTPRFRASAHVIILLADNGAEPGLVAKVARLPGESEALRREAASLHTLHDAGVDAGSIPRLVMLTQVSGHAALIESALAGRPLDPATVRRDPARWVDVAGTWLSAMPVGTTTTARRFGDLIADPLRRFADAIPGREDANRRLVSATLTALRPLREGTVPLVFEHGDFGHPNLLVDDTGRLGVLDWESGRPDGLPLHDLTFFLAYVAKAVHGGRESRSLPAAVARLLADPRSGALEALRGEADRLGIAPAVVPALLLACWARTVTSLASRVPGSSEEMDRWLRSNRYYLLWEDVLRRQDELARSLR